ncbi:MAG: siroheme decarboxylase [Thermodesulfobacteriota bacterium]|jgi:DNA-binding Lrp family transcriptional regulator|nr:siroheme decarboxylase [Thermodesulfobacteriota bacterium]
MDDIDKKILNMLQNEFPLVPCPFQVVADRLGIGEKDVLSRVKKLKDDGVIRRIGAIFDPRMLGYVSALCAARVAEKKMALFTAAVNASPYVTHNYRRNHDYNVWFTIIAPSTAAMEDFIAELKNGTGIEAILNMRAVRTFKIDARFHV